MKNEWTDVLFTFKLVVPLHFDLLYFATPTCITCICPTGSGWFQVIGTILIIPADHSLKGPNKQVTVSEMWL